MLHASRTLSAVTADQMQRPIHDFLRCIFDSLRHSGSIQFRYMIAYEVISSFSFTAADFWNVSDTPSFALLIGKKNIGNSFAFAEFRAMLIAQM